MKLNQILAHFLRAPVANEVIFQSALHHASERKTVTSSPRPLPLPWQLAVCSRENDVKNETAFARKLAVHTLRPRCCERGAPRVLSRQKKIRDEGHADE